MRDGISQIDGEIHSFLMIGQSNMAGRGDFGEVDEIHNPLCYMLRMGRWQPMSEPINPDRAVLQSGFHSGIGLAASFADSYATFSGCKVGLIPCADGGTTLSQWMPGEILFDHAVMQAKLATRTSMLTGILWHQGESDCKSTENILNYPERFTQMITQLRIVLGDPELPVILGEISENITPKWQTMHREPELNRALHHIAETLPNCAIASADGLVLKDDGIHFCSDSCRKLGRRYFAAWQQLSNQKTE